MALCPGALLCSCPPSPCCPQSCDGLHSRSTLYLCVSEMLLQVSQAVLWPWLVSAGLVRKQERSCLSCFLAQGNGFWCFLFSSDRREGAPQALCVHWDTEGRWQLCVPWNGQVTACCDVQLWLSTLYSGGAEQWAWLPAFWQISFCPFSRFSLFYFTAPFLGLASGLKGGARTRGSETRAGTGARTLPELL